MLLDEIPNDTKKAYVSKELNVANKDWHNKNAFVFEVKINKLKLNKQYVHVNIYDDNIEILVRYRHFEILMLLLKLELEITTLPFQA